MTYIIRQIHPLAKAPPLRKVPALLKDRGPIESLSPTESFTTNRFQLYRTKARVGPLMSSNGKPPLMKRENEIN